MTSLSFATPDGRLAAKACLRRPGDMMQKARIKALAIFGHLGTSKMVTPLMVWEKACLFCVPHKAVSICTECSSQQAGTRISPPTPTPGPRWLWNPALLPWPCAQIFWQCPWPVGVITAQHSFTPKWRVFLVLAPVLLRTGVGGYNFKNQTRMGFGRHTL